MRWFTNEIYEAWTNGDDASWEAMLAAYDKHVATIAPRLPPDLRRLATEERLHLHDAEFTSVVVDREAETIEMVLWHHDDRALRLRFGGATFVEEYVQLIGYAVVGTFGETRTCILAQEIEIADDGRLVLRLRLWPFHEFGIIFQSLELAEEPVVTARGEPARFSYANEPADD